MAIKNIIAMGVGFSPGSTKYLPTLGFIAGVAVPVVPEVLQGGGGGPKKRRKTWEERERARLADLQANQATIEAREAFERKQKYGALPPALEKALAGESQATTSGTLAKPLSPHDMQEYERIRVSLRSDDEEAFALILGCL